MRVASGIQPSGNLHLGNYFGAIQQYMELQEEHECFFFVVDYHALTTVRDADNLRRFREDCVCAHLALGLDPEKASVFVQSDVPEVTELALILSTVTPMGLLQRSHAYKDKLAQGLPADHGLFSYPVLMAADILIYNADIVPVGQDQKQHLEMTRDIVQRFNERYAKLFTLPEPRMIPVVPGIDGRKMSKSYGNSIGIFDSREMVSRKVMSIKTDAKPFGAPRDPESCNLFALFRLFADQAECQEIGECYRTGKVEYYPIKLRLIELIVSRFAAAKRIREKLSTRPGYVRTVLEQGAEKARGVACDMLERVRTAVGLDQTC